MTEIPHQDITFKVIGAAMRVHNEIGPGLREVIYQKALSAALRDAGLTFEEERPYEVKLEAESVGLLYVDHLVEERVVVETKVLRHLLTSDEVAQVITYLGVTGAPVGLLLNFGRRRLEYKRILPPRKFQDWRARTGRLAWQPPGVKDSNPVSVPNPL
jgi:GxxExxY protein